MRHVTVNVKEYELDKCKNDLGMMNGILALACNELSVGLIDLIKTGFDLRVEKHLFENSYNFKISTRLEIERQLD